MNYKPPSAQEEQDELIEEFLRDNKEPTPEKIPEPTPKKET